MVRLDELRTERLIMRRWLDSDREPFAALNADPRVRAYFPSLLDHATSDAVIEAFETFFDDCGFGVWALELTASGDFIGFTGLYPMHDDLPGAGSLEVCWRLAHSAWHQGYATESARAALYVAFTFLNQDDVWSMTAHSNQRSRAVIQRLGLHEITRAVYPTFPADDPLQPTVFYRITRTEYLARGLDIGSAPTIHGR